MQKDLKSASSPIPPRRQLSTNWLPYSLRVVQLFGLAGALAAAVHWLMRLSVELGWLKLLVGGGCLALWAISTLALRWIKRKDPQIALQAIQSADKTWNTPLNEKGVQIGILVFFVLLGVVVLWLLR